MNSKLSELPSSDDGAGFAVPAFSNNDNDLNDDDLPDPNWYLDSVTSWHMTSEIDSFTTHKLYKKDSTSSASDHKLVTAAIETVELKIDNKILELSEI